MKHWSRYLVLTLVVAFAMTSTTPAMAATAKKHHARAARPKISYKDARTTAMAKVPGGKIVKHELEQEQGKLVYSFDIRVPGKSGVEEVNVDAVTGTVIAHEHETPAMEKKEAAADKAKPPAKKKP